MIITVLHTPCLHAQVLAPGATISAGEAQVAMRAELLATPSDSFNAAVVRPQGISRVQAKQKLTGLAHDTRRLAGLATIWLNAPLVHAIQGYVLRP